MHDINKKRKHMYEENSSSKKPQRYHANFNKNDELKYLRDLEAKYNVLLPDRQPIVSLKRIQFKSSHFTKDHKRQLSKKDVMRDSAIIYETLGLVINNLEIKDKYSALAVCKLWNRAGNENKAWRNILIKNRYIDISILQRLILKNDTEYLRFEDVEMSQKSKTTEFFRFSSVQTLEYYKSDQNLLRKLLQACNHLVSFNSDTEDDCLLELIHPYVKNLCMENLTLNQNNNKVLKNLVDLEKLVVKTIDPSCYKLINLLFSIKQLKIITLHINNDIQSLIESVPNIETLEFTSIYTEFDSYATNYLMIEALKRCPSLKKIRWLYKYNQECNESVDMKKAIDSNNILNGWEVIKVQKLKIIALKILLQSSLPDCDVYIDLQ